MRKTILPSSDNEDDESEAEIPATDSDRSTDGNDAEETDSNEDNDDNDDEECFEVEAILNHKVEKGSKKLFLLIRWKGYDEEEDSWEPEENLETAQEILTEYLESQGGRASIISAASSSKKRKGRNSTTVETGSGRKKKRSTNSDNGISTPSGSAERRLPDGSWEDLVAAIDYIEEYTDPRDGIVKRFGFIRWGDGQTPYHTRHTLETLYAKCPQKMLKYYESHLVFRSNAPQAE